MAVTTDDRQLIQTRQRMTLKEFLAHDDGTNTRYELVDGVLVTRDQTLTTSQRLHSLRLLLEIPT